MAESILGLDIGSAKVSAVVCELQQANELLLRGTGHAATSGIDQTGITDETALGQSIMRAVQRAVRTGSTKPGRVIVGLPACKTRFAINSGMISIQNPSGTVQEDDVTTCTKRAMQVVKEPNEIMLHGSMIETRLDGHVRENPIGESGRQLEIVSRMIFTDQQLVDSITGIVKNLGFYVAGLVYDQFATGSACLSDAERQYGALLIDIGHTWTRASLFQKNTLFFGCILPLGSLRSSQDIAQCLRISTTDAERIKIKYGHVLPMGIPDGDIIPGWIGENGARDIRRRILAEIMRARLKETLVLIRKRFRKLPIAGLPVIITGGGSTVPGLGILASEIFEAPVRLGIHPQFQHTIRSIDDQVAVGAVLYGMKTGAITMPKTPPKSSWWQRLF